RAESPRILLVEKNPQLFADLSAALVEANYQICHCRDAEEALDLIGRQPPDAIISDVFGEHSGGEFRERVKQRPGMKDVPVMFLTPAQAPDIFLRHDDHGGTYYLRKSCGPEVLLRLLERVLDFAPVGR
ncbi:MAG: response regulator, partial [Pirellulales bacterium]|nr:response regulator [Pirellulales bacterium]